MQKGKPVFIFIMAFCCLFSVTAQPLLTTEQRSFLEKNASVIYSTDVFVNPDWQPVARQIKDKKIVLIGEFNHGSREVFLLKNELIRYLHQHHGFSTILFESGIGEMIFSEWSKKELSPLQMTYGLFNGWRSSEFRELMEYVKSNNIHIAGIDVQRSGGSFKRVLAEVAIQKNIDSMLYGNLEDRFATVQRDLAGKNVLSDTLLVKTHELVAAYQQINGLLKGNTTNDKERLISQTITNRIGSLQYMLQFAKDKNTGRRFAARDSMMAANVAWLCDSLYKNEKVLIIAHNYHIARHNDSLEVMGSILDRRYGNQLYTIGVFAGSGSFANNAGNPENMMGPDATATDIKHIIHALPGFVNYLPVSKTKGAEWLYRDIIVNDTFINLDGGNKMILSRHFDALLLLSKITPPVK